MISIKYKNLYIPYIVIPFIIFLMLFDQLYLNEIIVNYFPRDKVPEEYFWYAIFLGYPHITASFFTIKKGYLESYHKEFKNYKKIFLYFAIPIFLIFLGNIQFLYLYEMTLTVHHLLRQQTNLISIGLKSNMFIYYLVLLYSFILLNFYTDYQVVSFEILYELILYNIIFLFIIIIMLCFMYKNNKIGIILNLSSFIMVLLCFYFNYNFFGFVIFRLIHDPTAFYFYIIHNINYKKRKDLNNLVYASLFIFLGIALSFYQFYFSYSIVVFFGLFHYYFESFIWKKEYPHRKYLKIT